MSVFGDLAHNFFELGINVIPIYKDKRPPKGFKFAHWLERRQTEMEIDQLVKEYGVCPGIAVVCGEVSGIVGFDFDYKYDEKKMPAEMTKKKWSQDCSAIERDIKNQLPEWTLAKKAIEGWTSFYKWSPGMRTVGVDRNGVRMFDFKASGYIVIPPSTHSVVGDETKYYTWIEGDPMSDFETLPELDFSVVKDLSLAWGTRKRRSRDMVSRHERCFFHVLDLLKVEDDQSVIVRKLIEYDKKKHSKDPKGPYLSDKKHVRGTPKAYASQWVERISRYESSKAVSKSAPVGDEAWNHFFQSCFHDLRKDILSKNVFTKKREDSPWVPLENLEGVLRAYASKRDLKKHEVKDQVERFIYEKEDLSFLCDIPEYDGKDWVAQLCHSLSSPLFSVDEMTAIVKNWGAGIFSRIDDSNNQNRCLIFKGPQNMGKDEFVKSLVSGFNPYYELVTPPGQNKDWLEIISRLYVCHIEEFDQTAKVDMAFLKALITQPTSFFRESYGRSPSSKTTAASFISTVNPDDFFRDPTGNRRFVVIPVDGITFNYPRYNSPQVMAQFRYLYESNKYVLPAELEAKIKRYVDSLTPEGNEEIIEDMWKIRSGSIVQHQTKFSRDGEIFKIDQDTAATVFHDIAKTVGVTPAKVRRALKSKGYQGRDTISRWWSPESVRESMN